MHAADADQHCIMTATSWHEMQRSCVMRVSHGTAVFGWYIGLPTSEQVSNVHVQCVAGRGTIGVDAWFSHLGFMMEWCSCHHWCLSMASQQQTLEH